MTHKEFEKFLTCEIAECLKLMALKSSDYASKKDKLSNFKIAGKLQKCRPESALWGFDLKHRTSIQQGITDIENSIVRPLRWWRGKLRDHICYMFLLGAQIAERYGVDYSEQSKENPEDI